MTKAQQKRKQQQFLKLYSKLKELFPVKKTELNYETPWELLVAVILSAQCTDAQVNKVTKKLFKKYKALSSYAKAEQKEFEKDVYSTGFYRNKAKNIIAAAKKVKEKYKGVLPNTISELVTIPGVGRKTANVVLKNLYDSNEGIAVDTHVKRFANRFHFSGSNNPDIIERDLMEIIPKKEWGNAPYYIKQYGRGYGPARNWKRENDPLVKIYPKAGL